MHGIIQAAERQLDVEVDPEHVDFKEVVGGVSNLSPNVFEWLHKAYAELCKVDSTSALDRISYSKCWSRAEWHSDPGSMQQLAGGVQSWEEDSRRCRTASVGS